jgi:Holliday junction DNA helicase RuvA
VIGSLRGVLVDRPSPGEVIVEVGGVGYRASVTTSVLSGLGATGGEVFLHVHTHVREDAIVLFGFAHADERRCFEAVLGAHGVGPTLALAILSSLSPAALSTAVLEDDVDTLCRRGEEDGGPLAARAKGPVGPPHHEQREQPRSRRLLSAR